MLKNLLTALVCTVGVSLSVSAYAQGPGAASDCAAQATDKKLHGAALSSFLKKCERDAAESSCAAAAVEKKLAGAAKASFTKKCVKDATTH